MRIHQHLLRVTLVTGLLGLAASSAANAATLTVTKVADTADGSCSLADCSLREALATAESDAPGDTVVVPAGTYTATMTSGNGVWSPDGQYTLVGAGAGKTIIDGGQLGRTFAFYGQITMRGVTVTGGKAPNSGCTCGGGFEVRQGGFLTLEDSVVEGNSAPGGGGGIDVDSQSRAILRDVLVRQNTSPDPGAGINVEPVSGATGTLAMTNVTISGNTTTNGASGAGLANAGATTATNVTISGNASAADGGGILNLATGTLALNGATLANNIAPGLGAGIRNLGASGAVTLRNTIVADRVAGDCSSTSTPAVVSQGHNLALGTSCALTAPGDLPSTDPHLGPLAANGGNGLPTHALTAGSAAIDAGDNAACIATDARGLSRPSGVQCDIGAFEVQVAPPAGPAQPGGPGQGTGTTPTPTTPTAPPVGGGAPSGKATLGGLGKSLRVTAKGTGRWSVACRNVAGDRCRVSAILQITVKQRGKRARKVTVGTVTGTVAGGKSGTVVVKLNATGRKRLGRKLDVRVVGSSTNAAGAKVAVGAKLTVLAPKKRK
jgi:CSLREA domain-containing protein